MHEAIIACVKCNRNGVIHGTLVDIELGSRPHSGGYFHPDNWKMSLTNLFGNEGVRVDLVVCACPECGFVWSKTDATQLTELVADNCKPPPQASQPEDSGPKPQCLNCKGSGLVNGAFVAWTGRGNTTNYALFRPDCLKWWTFTAYGAGVALDHNGKACMNCGFAWTHLDSGALRDFLIKYCKL